jgi:endo-1,4-beta-D-glucanase Y
MKRSRRWAAGWVAAMLGLSGSLALSCETGGGSATGSTSPGSGSTGTTGTTGTGGSPSTTGAGATTSSSATGGGGSPPASSSSSGTGGTGGHMPTPPEPGVNFPFPQNRQYANCTYPNYDNAAVQAAYQTWKTTLVTTSGAKGYRRVQRSSSEKLPNHTVSEGIGYGMILAVYMNDQPLFDDLWRYEQQFLDANQLMNWDIDPNGNVAGANAATDADEDMAWALLMADRQWGGSGALSNTYLNIAKAQIAAIWNHEIYQSKLAALGDTWGDWNDLNISYFAPAYYRTFATVDSHDWAAVIKTVYDTIDNNLNANNKNQTNGLVPGFSTSQGGPMNGEPFTYQYDACRTPFRIGLDWCINGEPRAKAYTAKTSSFFSAIGASHIVDGYQLDGTPMPMGTGQASPFIGPAAVGAMSDPSYQPFLQAAYTEVATNNLVVGGIYYGESWTALSLLMMSGNFIDYTNLP